MLTLNDYRLINGIYYPAAAGIRHVSRQKAAWEKVYSENTGDLPKKAHNTAGEWPEHKHFDTILDIGCGYGRRAFQLSLFRKITCGRYYGIDVSENALKNLVRLKERERNFFPRSEFNIICASAETLPIADDSVDFVMSDSVFMHMNKAQVANTLTETARVMKPGGSFVFHNSFYNRGCPRNAALYSLKRIKFLGGCRPYYSHYSLDEIGKLLRETGLSGKCPDYIIKRSEKWNFIPKMPGIFAFFARRVNGYLSSVERLSGMMTQTFSVYTKTF